jgi:hypothetical protein
LAEIAENRRQRQELVERIAELDAQLEGPAGLIAQASRPAIRGPQIAAAAGVSKPRVYQIRDGRR